MHNRINTERMPQIGTKRRLIGQTWILEMKFFNQDSELSIINLEDQITDSLPKLVRVKGLHNEVIGEAHSEERKDTGRPAELYAIDNRSSPRQLPPFFD